MAHNEVKVLALSSVSARFLCTLLVASMLQISSQNSAFRSSWFNIKDLNEEESEVIHPSVTRLSTRRRRDVSNDSEPSIAYSDILQISFKSLRFNRSFDAELRLNKKFVAPLATVHVLGLGGRLLHRSKLDNCFYNGRLAKEANSLVSMAYCGNLVGLIHTDEAKYIIKPLGADGDQSMNYTTAPHVIQRQLHSNPDQSFQHVNFSDMASRDIKFRARLRRSAENERPSEKTIETLLVVDQKMVEYHGLDAARRYTLTIASITHDILRDSSIGSNTVNMVVVKVLILVAPQENLLINHHARNTLISFGKWTSLQWKNTNGFDYAVLLTRFDVCKDSEEPCDNSGLTFTGGICKFPTSVSLIEENGLGSAFELAHQTGHRFRQLHFIRWALNNHKFDASGRHARVSFTRELPQSRQGRILGMEHDGIGNSCKGQKRIMDEKGGQGKGAFLWSTCSVDYFQKFLRTKQSKCLDDLPPKNDKNTLNLYQHFGSVYDIDEQCKLFAGKDSKGCYYTDPVEICIELLCLVPDRQTCIGTSKPAVDGTSCGMHRWCKHGRCVEKHSPDSEAIDGGWSSWSEFNTCTRRCGGGVAYRQRKCESPKPRGGGKFCEGNPRQYHICNTEACLESTVNFRKMQCRKHSGMFLGDSKYDWTFIGKDEVMCYLECTAQSNYSVTKHFGRAIDGTNCYDQAGNVPGRCISGECIPVGCDLVLESKAKRDRCGVCKGDGSSCKHNVTVGQRNPAILVNVTDKRGKAPQKEDVNATESSTSTLSAAKSGGVENSTVATSSNSTLNPVRMNLNSTNINSTEVAADIDHISKVLQKLKTLRSLMKTVLLKRCSGNDKCLMKYKYFDMKHKRTEITRHDDFEWVVLSSGCSLTCGVGTATLFPECRRVDDGSPVARTFCDKKIEPVVKTKACKMPSCPIRWVTGAWDSCSKSCSGGFQSRGVHCMEFVNEDFIISDDMCKDLKKPSSKQSCNRDPCPPKWVTEPFGQCSTTCGKGVQRREVVCRLSKPNNIKVILDDAKCRALEKPQQELICNVHVPCPGENSCGGNITGASGVLKSPRFPNSYPSSKECISEVTVAKGKAIMLEFTTLKIGHPSNSINKCGGDFLRVTDGGCSDANNHPYTTYCGVEKPKDAYISTKNKICLKFVSDEAKTNKGYSVKYTEIEEYKNEGRFVDICDVHGKVLNSFFGAISSPNYPAVYPVNEYCKCTVSAPDGGGLVLSFKGFNVGTKGANGECLDDYLEVQHDGISRRLCGDEKDSEIAVAGKKFTVSFYSMDIRISGMGFVMTYITKQFLKQQFDFINNRKRVSSPKKDIINQVKPAPKPIIKNKASLISVLDLLGSSDSRNDTGVNLPKVTTDDTRKSKVPDNSHKLLGFEDYTKAGIYKKEGVPRSTKSNQQVTNQPPVLSFLGKPAINRYVPNVAKPVVQPSNQQSLNKIPSQFNRYLGNSLAAKRSPNYLNSADQWKIYWEIYLNKYNRRNFIPRGCPNIAALPCQAVSLSYPCQNVITCGVHQRMHCCPTYCPYKPSVCVWT